MYIFIYYVENCTFITVIDRCFNWKIIDSSLIMNFIARILEVLEDFGGPEDCIISKKT